MHRKSLLLTVLITASAAWSLQVEARPGRQNQYPNGAGFSCNACHAGGGRTPFGFDVAANLVPANAAGVVQWGGLFDLDSDQDGFTNGEELGDAYGVWERGDADPTLLSSHFDENEYPDLVGNQPVAEDVTATVTEDVTYSGQVTAIDADGDTLRYRVAQTPTLGTVDLNAETGEYTYTPDANVYGADAFTFQVFDGNNILGTWDGDDFTPQAAAVNIEITPVNDPPTILTGFNLFVDETQTLTFNSSATDVEDGFLAVSAGELPEGATFDGVTGVFEWTPNYFQAGTYQIPIMATDNEGLTTTVEVQVTVNNVNRPPDILGLNGTPEGIEGDTLVFSAEAEDIDVDDVLTYTWDFGTGETLEGASVSYVWPQDGEFDVTLTVSDGFDDATETYQVVVQNVPPITEAGDDFIVDEGTAYTMQGSFVDPGRLDEHTYAWDFGNGDTSDELNPLYAWGDNGTFNVSLVVADDDADSTDTLTVTVNNVAPVADAGGTRSIDEGTAYTFEGQYTDPGFLDEHTHAWDLGNGNTFDIQAPTYTFADQASYTATYTVTDDDGGTDTDTITINIINVAPSVISDPPLYAQLEEEYTYQVLAEDPGDDVISYEYLQGAPGMTMDANGLVTYFPDPNDEEETFTVSIRVYDEDGGEYTHSYELRVGLPDRDLDGAIDDCEIQYGFNPDDPTDGPQDADGDGYTNAEECQLEQNPLVSNAPQVPSINEPGAGAVVSRLPPISLYVNNAFDPDGDELTYKFEIYADAQLNVLSRTWIDVPEGGNRTGVAIDFTLTENSRYYWRARAYDQRGASPWTDTVSFVYSLVNDPPTTPSLRFPEGQIVSPPVFEVGASQDPEGDVISYEIQVFEEGGEFFDGAFGLLDLGQDVIRWTSSRQFVENATYTWRARASNNTLVTSEWSDSYTFFYNAISTPPTTPEILSPENGVTLTEPAALVFETSIAEDEDGDPLSYVFRISTTPNFAPGEVVAEQEVFANEEEGLVRWTLVDGDLNALVENNFYWWDVRAKDAAGESQPAVGSFLLSFVNDPPGKLTIQAPAPGVSLKTQTPTFSWINTSDPEGEEILYAVVVYTDEALTDIAWQRSEIPSNGGPGGLTEVVSGELPDNTPYWWRVRGVDSAGTQGEWSDAARFTIAVGGEPPNRPILAGPASDSVFSPDEEISLLWRAAVDPEGDPITYRVEVLNASGSLVTFKDDLPPSAEEINNFTLGVVLIDGNYNWRVRASSLGQPGPWSNSALFSVRTPVEEPDDEEEPEVVPPTAGGGGDGGGCVQAPGVTGSTPASGLGLMALLAGLFWLRRRD